MNSLAKFGVLLLLAIVGSSNTANASSNVQCTVRLIIELTPDVPNPRDAEFLSSLLSNHTDYQLKWVRHQSKSAIVVDLSGPGSDDACRDVIQTMRNDGRILSI